MYVYVYIGEDTELLELSSMSLEEAYPDVLLLHFQGLNKGDAGLDDAVKEAFGQLGPGFSYHLKQSASIELELFFERGIHPPYLNTTSFTICLEDRSYVNDTCAVCIADELIVEDEHSHPMSEPVVVCLDKGVEISLSTPHPHLLRAHPCTAMVTVNSVTRQCRNKSRRICLDIGEYRCHYHHTK